MSRTFFQQRGFWLGAALLAATLTIYSPVAHFDFVNFDDPVSVSENQNITAGLTFHGLKWAFTTSVLGHWKPLTSLSHMLDCEVFGLNAGAHHLVNLALHLASVALLFALLRRVTGTVWPSIFAAGLFALHPLNVESVAWITERKTVLSGFFSMLALFCYVRFAQSGKRTSYALALLCFALGLMAKATLVTLPFVLLLLDFWPLGRMRFQGDSSENASQSGRIALPLRSLIVEKWPFFVVMAISIIVSFWAGKATEALATLQELPLELRVTNAVVSYLRYIGKTVWPVDLAVLYPYPPSWPVWMVLASLFTLTAVTFIAFLGAKRCPYLLVGWLWFLGTLVPVLGLTQAGAQAMADRYMYLAGIGLFIAFVWAAKELADHGRGGRWEVSTLALVLLLACAFLSSQQLRRWQNSVTLFEHTVAVMPDNHVAHERLASAYANQRRFNAAIAHYEMTIRLKRTEPDYHYNYGFVLAAVGRTKDAISEYREALRLKPAFTSALNNIVHTYFVQGRIAEAIQQYSDELRAEPANPTARRIRAALYVNRGASQAERQRWEEAISDYRLALQDDSSLALAHYNLAAALFRVGRINEGVGHLRKAHELAVAQRETELARQIEQMLSRLPSS